MPTKLRNTLAGILLVATAGLSLAQGQAANPIVIMETSLGDIKIQLDAQKAPLTVQNFLHYIDNEHYDGTIFHRVIAQFMAQGGGFDADMRQRPTLAPIANESLNGLYNERGSIAMARTQVPDSATSQFFINLKMNMALDGRPGKPGYAVFGKVIGGMEVIDEMALQPTGSVGMYRDVPVEPIVIRRAYRQPAS